MLGTSDLTHHPAPFAKPAFVAMSDTPQGSSQSPYLTNVIPGSKRKQVFVTGVQQSIAESTSKKARLGTSQSPVPSGCPSQEESDQEDIDAAKEVESFAAKPHYENAEAELSASVPAPQRIKILTHLSLRTAPEGLDRTYLRVFQTYPYD